MKEVKDPEFISTGVASLNILFGGGIDKGIPEGKVSMIAADSSLGKSFIALKIAKNAQAKGKSVILFDSEKAYLELIKMKFLLFKTQVLKKCQLNL